MWSIQGCEMSNHFRHAVLPVVLTIIAMVHASAGQSSISANSSSSSAVLPQGTAVVVELEKSIDAKKAKIGDLVKAKVTQDVVSGGKVVISRGSKAIGHVTEVKPRDKENPQSILGLVFDKLDLKHGEEVTFNGALQALAPPVQSPDFPGSSNYDSEARGSEPASYSRSRPLVNPRDRVDHTRDDALQNAGDPNTYATEPNALHNGKLSAGNRGVFGMPAISFKSQPGTSAPELISTRTSIKLESGTQIVLEMRELLR